MRHSCGDINSPEGQFDTQQIVFHVWNVADEVAAQTLAGANNKDPHPDGLAMWVGDAKCTALDKAAGNYEITADYCGCVKGEKRKRRESTQHEIVVWTDKDEKGTKSTADDTSLGTEIMIAQTVITDTYCTLNRPSHQQVATNVTPPQSPSPAVVPFFISQNKVQWLPNGWVLQSREIEHCGPTSGGAYLVTDTFAWFDPGGRPAAVTTIINPG
ncbi:MAG: hypothetical protein AAF236_16260 [Verrucomicrobiota bacterium]